MRISRVKMGYSLDYSSTCPDKIKNYIKTPGD
nr:MAG TPA: hypothetical protein [Caudoviricetes sp.]